MAFYTDKTSSSISDREQGEPREHTNKNEVSLLSEAVPIAAIAENKGSSDQIIRPCYRVYTDPFVLNGKVASPGVYWHGTKMQRDGTELEVNELICSPLKIIATTVSVDNDNHGRKLWFIDAQGKEHEWAMPMRLLKGDGEELRGELLNLGLTFEPKKRTEIVRYIMLERPSKHIFSTDFVGWYGNSFVLPSQVIGSDEVIFQSESVIANDFLTKGTLEGWQKEIGSFCIGNQTLLLGVFTALSGPLLPLVNRMQGGGLHFVGDSSSGKSTTIEVAASLWGSSEFVRSWRATSNGLEGIAATRNQTCLILDEIGEAPPDDIGNVIYMLSNGQGKQRAGRTGHARRIQRWTTNLLSTGERTVDSIMNEVGKKTHSGQSVRLLNIPCAFSHGVFDNLHEFKSGRELSDHLKKATQMHYGHIGPAFVVKLVENKDRDYCRDLEAIISSFPQESLSSLSRRAISFFSLLGLAGTLALQWELLPWTDKDVQPILIVQEAFKLWLDFQGEQKTEESRILQSISDFISKHSDSRFSCLTGSDKSINNRAGWYKDNGDQTRTYLFTRESLEAICKFDIARIGRALKATGWIRKMDPKRLTKKTRIPGMGSRNLYYIQEPEEGPEVFD